MSKSLQVTWNVDMPTSATLNASDLHDLEDLNDAELLDFINDWAHDEAIKSWGVWIRDKDAVLAWVKAKIKEMQNGNDHQA